MLFRSMNKDSIVSAVERYLSKRGLTESTVSKLESPPASVASIVDKFLAGHGLPAVAVVDPKVVPLPAPVTPPKLDLADFVCENDIRQAINQGRKIYIGKKSIVTPSARDLGIQYDVLVVAER